MQTVFSSSVDCIFLYNLVPPLCSKKSHAKFYDMRGGVRAVDVCERRRLMATVGADREVKIWSLRDVM